MVIENNIIKLADFFLPFLNSILAYGFFFLSQTYWKFTSHYFARCASNINIRTLYFFVVFDDPLQ